MNSSFLFSVKSIAGTTLCNYHHIIYKAVERPKLVKEKRRLRNRGASSQDVRGTQPSGTDALGRTTQCVPTCAAVAGAGVSLRSGYGLWVPVFTWSLRCGTIRRVLETWRVKPSETLGWRIMGRLPHCVAGRLCVSRTVLCVPLSTERQKHPDTR